MCPPWAAPAPGCQHVTPGPGLGVQPWRPRTFQSFDLQPQPRGACTHLTGLWARACVSAPPSLCFPSAPRGRGVGKQFVIVCWEVPPWPGAESDFWFGIDSGPRGWHSLPSAKHLSTPIGLVCVRLEDSPCRGRADVSNGF